MNNVRFCTVFEAKYNFTHVLENKRERGGREEGGREGGREEGREREFMCFLS